MFIFYFLALTLFKALPSFIFKLIQFVGRIHFLAVWLRAPAFCWLLAGDHFQVLEATHSSLPHGLLQYYCLLHQEIRRITFPLLTNLIMRVTSCHLCHIPLLGSKSQALLTLKGRGLYKEWTPGGESQWGSPQGLSAIVINDKVLVSLSVTWINVIFKKSEAYYFFTLEWGTAVAAWNFPFKIVCVNYKPSLMNQETLLPQREGKKFC